MRKHFLLLLLMTLLPLAGWSVERITVTLGTINKVYGEADPAVTELDFSWTRDGGGTTTEVTAANLLHALDYRRVSAGDEVNSVKYYTMVANSNKPTDWVLVIANQGVINIMPKSLGTGTTALVTGISIADITGISYTGQAQTPDLSVHYTGALVNEDLVKDRDYEVVWDNNTDAGTAKATLTGKGNYEGSVVKEFTIAARSLANVTIADIPDQTFAWDDHNVAIAQTPGITVTDAELGTTLVAGTDYVMQTTDGYTDGYKDNYNAGTGLVRIVGKGNYDDTTTAGASFTINPMSIVDAEGNLTNGFGLSSTAAAEGLVYTGAALTPSIAFRCHGTSANVTANRIVTYANNINATTAESKATITWTGINNLTGSYTFKFDIAQRPVEDLTFDASLTAGQEYTGSQITKNTTGMVTYGTLPALVAGTDFDVVNGENLNVGTDAGSTAFSFKGNYTGDVTKYFDITAATLTVKAKNFTKSLGNADPTSDELAEGKYYEITGFVGEEATTVTVTGAPTFAIAGHTEVAGPKTGVISISSVNGLSAPNYSFAIGATADLIISSAGVAIAATNATQTYGYKLPTLDKDAFGFTATGLLSGENITALTFTVKDANNKEYAAGDMLEVGEYTITPSAASATSDSYEFSYTPATLTINPYIVKFVAKNQTIDYGTEPGLAKNGKWNNVSNTTWNNNRLEMWYGEDENNLTKATTDEFFNTYSLWKQDFVESLTWEVADNKPVAEPGTIKVNLKADYDSKNFTVTTEDGNVTYNAASVPTALVLDKEAGDVLTQINTYNGQTMDVTVKLYRENVMNAGTAKEKTYSWKKAQWNTLVLPFEVSVRELSKAIGYAIVNVYDETETTPSNAAFKLTMGSIPANTPFLLKTDDAIPEGFELKFEDKEITAPTAEMTEMTLTAANGISFIGTYENVAINATTSQGLDDTNPTYWKYYADNEIKGVGATSTNTYTVYPFGAFFGWTAPTATSRGMTITVQDIDGTVTSIRSIDAEDKYSTDGLYNLQGVKMQGAPTQKGIYIKNGKKVVIK